MPLGESPMTRPPEDAPLPARLDSAAAAALQARLLARRGTPLVLDMAPVRHLGTQCAQVLLAARRDWAAAGCDLRIAGLRPDLQALLAEAGLAAALGLGPVVEEAAP
jgi:anti-anti-sigma regulatory factor